jgi:hypothetical protein
MPTTITTKLPNPDCTIQDNSSSWDQFILAQGIATANDPVVARYQNLESSEAEFLDSDWLIHYLNRLAHGPQSVYAQLADTYYGSDDPESTFRSTLEALDAVFVSNSYRFSADSQVFKGVNTKPYYEIHRFDQLKPGDKVVMPGFLSTSVCRDKARDFAGSAGVLLVIRGLDIVDAVVPANSCVETTKRSKIAEQEIILDRGIALEVESVIAATGDWPREVQLRAIAARP